MGRIDSRLIVASLAVKASAISTPRYSSPSLEPEDLKGNTATEVIAGLAEATAGLHGLNVSGGFGIVAQSLAQLSNLARQSILSYMRSVPDSVKDFFLFD